MGYIDISHRLVLWLKVTIVIFLKSSKNHVLKITNNITAYNQPDIVVLRLFLKGDSIYI